MHHTKNWLPSSLPLCPESSLLMAADPFISTLRQPDGALMSRHCIRTLPFLDQAKLLCVRVCVWVFPVYWCCSSGTPLWRYLAGHAADPVSLAELGNTSLVGDGPTGVQLMRAGGFSSWAAVYVNQGSLSLVSSFVTWLRSNLGVEDALFLALVCARELSVLCAVKRLRC